MTRDLNPRVLPFLLAALSALGPFSVDTYLPALLSIGESLHATPVQVQQTMTAYFVTFCATMLWHGAISDALGRRRVILAGLGFYAAASLFCVFAYRIEMLWIGRALQGLAGGVGGVVGRAIVRDRFDGTDAIKQMALVTVIFSAAPAVAPVIGGWLLAWFEWHAIFVFLTVYALVLGIACIALLPETLPKEQRHSMHPLMLWRGYRMVLGDGGFFKLSAASAVMMSGMMIYIMASPMFVIRHLGLTPQSFPWLFLPTIAGMVAGNVISSRLAGKKSARTLIQIGAAIMAAAAVLNVGMNLLMAPQLPWAVLPMGLYSAGLFTGFAALQLQALDLFPERRGMASSCQSFWQTLAMTLTAGVLAPALWDSTLTLALGMAGCLIVGMALYFWGMRSCSVRAQSTRKG